MGDLSDIREGFSRNVSRGIAYYYNMGTGYESTLGENLEAFKRYRLKPALLPEGAMENKDIDVSTTLLGQKVSCPIGIAPSGYHRSISTDGEISTAVAAANQNVCYIMSLAAQSSVRHIYNITRGSIKWKNIYPFTEEGRPVKLELMKNAEKHGITTFVMSVDSQMPGWKKRPEWQIDFYGHDLPDITEACRKVGSNPGITGMDAAFRYFLAPKFTWKDFQRLTQETKMPIIAKGILTAEEAKIALSHGAAVVYVSNHGGRQLDGTPASLYALLEVRAAVGDKVEVYVDGGFRSGVDVFKALALGADAVFLGRPILWGLGSAGQDGVEEVIRRMREELVEAMKYTGCTSLKDIDRSKIVANAKI